MTNDPTNYAKQHNMLHHLCSYSGSKLAPSFSKCFMHCLLTALFDSTLLNRTLAVTGFLKISYLFNSGGVFLLSFVYFVHVKAYNKNVTCQKWRTNLVKMAFGILCF